MVDSKRHNMYLEYHEKELVHDLQETITPKFETARGEEDRLSGDGRNKRLPSFGVFVLGDNFQKEDGF